MMKQLLLTVTIALLATTLQAQKSKRGFEIDSTWRNKTHYELGLNVSEFIKTFIVPNNNNNLGANATTYLLSFKSIFKCGAAVRFGLGGRISDKDTQSDSFTGTLNVKNNQVNTRLGFEWQFNLGRRWNTYAGADIIYSNGKQSSETFSTPPNKFITSSTVRAFGGGPVVGIQFRISKRISLLTEAALYAQKITSTDKQIDTSFPANNTQTKTVEKNISFIVPQSLFLIITF